MIKIDKFTPIWKWTYNIGLWLIYSKIFFSILEYVSEFFSLQFQNVKNLKNYSR